jgi:uncharacterized RDD family membrane protein YckC
MTATPPPGNYPPPPPQPGEYQPPEGAGRPASSPAALPTDAYTPWATRALAALIDYAPYAVVLGIGYGIEAATQETVCIKDTSGYNVGDVCATGNSTLGVAAFLVSVLAGLVYVVWNYGYKQGTTGSSIGKSILKFKVVSENTGQPLGFGLSFLRQIAHGIDAIICYVGFLFPLWDAKRQTLADKIVTSVCLPIS